MTAVLARALAGAPLTVNGSEKILDFVWVGTVVDALIKAGLGAWIQRPVNIGSGVGVTLLDLAKRIIQLTRSPSRICVAEGNPVEVHRFVADVKRARALLELETPADPLQHLSELVPPPDWSFRQCD